MNTRNYTHKYVKLFSTSVKNEIIHTDVIIQNQILQFFVLVEYLF